MGNVMDNVIEDVLQGDGGRTCVACIHSEREVALAKALKMLSKDLDPCDPRNEVLDDLFEGVRAVA
jgi:hypothetical protein